MHIINYNYKDIITNGHQVGVFIHIVRPNKLAPLTFSSLTNVILTDYCKYKVTGVRVK